MKHQALFSSKDKSTIIKVSSAAILLGALRAKMYGTYNVYCHFIFFKGRQLL